MWSPREREKRDSRADEREGQGRRGTGMKVKKHRNKNISPTTLTCYKDSKPCPTLSQYQLDPHSDIRYMTPSPHPTTPITLATLQIKTYTFTNSVQPNEMAHNEPPHQILHCLSFHLDARMTISPSATMDMSKIKVRSIYLRNTGVKGLKGLAQILVYVQ